MTKGDVYDSIIGLPTAKI